MSDTAKPTAKIVDPYAGMTKATDIKGRVIYFKPLSFLEQTRIMRAVKAADVEKSSFMNIAFIAAGVRYIDGVPCPTVRSEEQLDAAIDRLDHEGMIAVVDAIATEAGATQTEAEFKEAVKN